MYLGVLADYETERATSVRVRGRGRHFAYDVLSINDGLTKLACDPGLVVGVFLFIAIDLVRGVLVVVAFVAPWLICVILPVNG